jgi:hypothetical protein
MDDRQYMGKLNAENQVLRKRIETLETELARQLKGANIRLDNEVKRAIGLTWGQAQQAFHDANVDQLHGGQIACLCTWPTRRETL